jgi:hypothetical protein
MDTGALLAVVFDLWFCFSLFFPFSLILLVPLCIYGPLEATPDTRSLVKWVGLHVKSYAKREKARRISSFEQKLQETTKYICAHA